jgi:hypothetical protein
MDMFRECGGASFAISAFFLLSMLASLVALSLAVLKPKWGLVLSVVALAASCAPPAAGVVGTELGKRQIDQVLGSVDPGQRERIRAVGEAEARQCTSLGLIAGGLPALLSVVALGIGAARKRSSSA